MKRFTVILALVFIALPAWCAKKITVAQLGELLRTLQQEKKSDADAAAALKQVELTEQLTRPTMSSLANLVSGPLLTEQIYVLEARSAILAPPASDLPSTPAPDAVAQKAILAKVDSYIGKTYEQLPLLTATKTTLRFQDNVEALDAHSGLAGGAKDVVTSSSFSSPASFIHYINSTAREVVLEHGAETKSAEKDQTRWGANKMIALEEPDPGLGLVFKEAQASEGLRWLRWELINGRPAAVFSFAISKPKSRLAVNVCCFPNVEQAGIATFYTATTAPMLAEGGGGGGGGATGNFQTTTQWHEFKTTAPYHGRLFIDPDTGIVLRMITEAELRPTEVVHQLDTRVDFGAVKTTQGIVFAPVRTVVNSVVVPNGESGAGGYSTRCTLFTSEYSEYRVGAGK
jgi:hypothetical protein